MVEQLVIMVLAGEHLLCKATRCSMCVGLSFLCEITAVNFIIPSFFILSIKGFTMFYIIFWLVYLYYCSC